MYKRIRGRLQTFVPAYAVIPLFSCLAFNCLIYFGTGWITEGWRKFDFTTAFDRMVPLLPAFVAVYLGCYVFWAVNYILIARVGKEYCMRFVTADLMSRLVCAVFFLLLPTTNVRPGLTGGGFWSGMLGMVWQIDSPSNLFPSIHCLISWFCYIGLRGRKEVPRWYRGMSLVLAILVFVSTQVTKQHYIADVIGGVVIAEVCFYIGFHTEWYRSLTKIFDRITGYFSRKADPADEMRK
ncbi:phosphatase PAP2 family protein [Anaerolentibacter hominis]|uniref:phosphatase PAP2 family protein n=1 Tax=Anaerolentibacter hominis TaxID=3079009 RepID=UPI0031B84BFE